MPTHANLALDEFQHEILVEIAALGLRADVPSGPGGVRQLRILALGVELRHEERLPGPRAPVLHGLCIGLPFLIVVDREDVHILAGGLEHFVVHQFVVPLVEAAAQIEVVGIVLFDRLGHLLQIDLQTVGDESPAVGGRSFGELRPGLALALVEPLLSLLVVDVRLGPLLQTAVQRIVLPRNLIVREIADAVGIVLVLGDGRDLALDILVELGVEDHRKVVGITLPARPARPGLFARGFDVAVELAHRTDDHRVGHRLGELAHGLHVGPRTQSVEPAGLEHRGLLTGPLRGRPELLLQLGLLTVRTAGAEHGHALADVEVAFGGYHPPASADLLRAEKAGRLQRGDFPAAVLVGDGVFAGREAVDAVDRVGEVVAPCRGLVLAGAHLVGRFHVRRRVAPVGGINLRQRIGLVFRTAGGQQCGSGYQKQVFQRFIHGYLVVFRFSSAFSASRWRISR